MQAFIDFKYSYNLILNFCNIICKFLLAQIALIIIKIVTLLIQMLFIKILIMQY